jgi:hypothetical protein
MWSQVAIVFTTTTFTNKHASKVVSQHSSSLSLGLTLRRISISRAQSILTRTTHIVKQVHFLLHFGGLSRLHGTEPALDTSVDSRRSIIWRAQWLPRRSSQTSRLALHTSESRLLSYNTTSMTLPPSLSLRSTTCTRRDRANSLKSLQQAVLNDILFSTMVSCQKSLPWVDFSSRSPLIIRRNALTSRRHDRHQSL